MLYNSNIAICPQGAATIKYVGLLGIPTFSHGPLNLDKQFNALAGSNFNLAGSNFKESSFIVSSIFIEPKYPVPEQVAPSNAISLKENSQQKMEWDVGKSDTRSNYSINIDACHVALRDFLKSLPSRRVERHQ